jgi:hypothetical protein
VEKGRGEGNLRGQQVPSHEEEGEEEGHGNLQDPRVTSREVGEVCEAEAERLSEKKKGYRRDADMAARDIALDRTGSASK